MLLALPNINVIDLVLGVKSLLIIATVVALTLGYLGIVAFGKSITTLYILMAVLDISWSAVVSLPFGIYSPKGEKEQDWILYGNIQPISHISPPKDARTSA